MTYERQYRAEAPRVTCAEFDCSAEADVQPVGQYADELESYVGTPYCTEWHARARAARNAEAHAHAIEQRARNAEARLARRRAATTVYRPGADGTLAVYATR
jgi:hypothetical protein